MTDIEYTTQPRWLFPPLSLVEHVRHGERSPEPAKKRLIKRITALVEYRCGVVGR